MTTMPQPQLEPVTLRALARQLRPMGICVADATFAPPGDGADDAFFVDYALPALSRATDAQPPAGVCVTAAQVVGRPGELIALRLIASNGQADVPAAHGLPAYSDAALARVARSIEQIAEPLRSRAAAAGEVQLLSEQLANTYEVLALIYQLGGSITIDSPTPQFLMDACLPTTAAMEVCETGVVIWDQEVSAQVPMSFGKLALTAGELEEIDAVLREHIHPTDEHASLLINDTSAEPGFEHLHPRVRQLLAVPIRRRGRTLGCVFAADKDVAPEVFGQYNHGMFTSIDRKLLGAVAVHLAMFLENRKLFSDAESLMLALLHCLVAAVDAKDAYTCGHSVRVALFAQRLAEAAGFDATFCERVYLAGLLHDVGKIGVDDAVLRKAGKLTDEEFDQVKRHPQMGYNILEGIPQIVDVLSGVLYHHEKYNGRGYPQGLAGEQIPLLGRLMCIADSFDAMTSSRTYRPAMTREAAMAEIKKCGGTQFDPRLADLFCTLPDAEIERLIAAERERRLPAYALLQRAA